MRLTKYKSGSGHKDKGFTIVEIIVAITIGAITIGSAFLILTSQLHLSQRARDLTVVNAYVENKVESLRSLGFLGLSDGSTNVSSELPSELSSPRSGTVQISSFSSSIKKVDVTVNYNDQGTNRTYSYTTYIGELGVGQY